VSPHPEQASADDSTQAATWRLIMLLDFLPVTLPIPHPIRAGFHDDDLKAQIEADTGIRPPFALEAFGDLDGDVRQSIARIKASPFIPDKDSVRGFVYEVETGRLREVKE